jgi:hypothetical protein
MKKNAHLVHLIFFILCFLIPATGTPGGETVKKDQLLQAIASGCNYLTEVLMDKNGKSKCEYSIVDGRWMDYEPAWHTGQLMYALVRAYDVTGKKQYLQNAKKAGDWWCSLQIRNHPVLNGMVNAIHGSGVEYIVFATVSDGTAGLFNLWKRTGIPKYAEVPTRAGEWMFRNLYLPDKGLCYDMVDPLTGEVQKVRSAFWPDKEIQTLNDVARPNNEGSLFLDMYRYTGDERFKSAFLNLANSLVEKQGTEGLWMDFTPNDSRDHSIHPRFNLWYAESLLDAYDLTGDKKYLQPALKTALMYQKLQQKDGTFYYTNYTDGTPPDKSSVSGSTVAFAGIIYLRLLKTGAGAFEKNIETCYDWLLRNHFPENHPDPNLRGAFIETKVRMSKGKSVVINRDLGTVFAVRFFCDYYDYMSTKK